MVLPKEHHFGVKQHLMRGDRGDTEEAGLAVSDELAPARWEASYQDGTHTVQYQRAAVCLPG